MIQEVYSLWGISAQITGLAPAPCVERRNIKEIKIMKTTTKDFAIFKKECRKWIDKFELNNWQINFEHSPLGEKVGASCSTDIRGYVANISLNTELEDEHKNIEAIKMYARHEVIHVLLGRFSEQGRYRFVNLNEIDEAEEELVRKLEHIIK